MFKRKDKGIEYASGLFTRREAKRVRIRIRRGLLATIKETAAADCRGLEWQIDNLLMYGLRARDIMIEKEQETINQGNVVEFPGTAE